jgi:DNA-binding SARP family transcriptional activator
MEWQDKMRPSDLSRLCAKALEAEIEPVYVRRLIQRRKLVPEGAAADLEAWPWPLKIYTLGRFALVRDGKPVMFTGKGQTRPLDLLKILVATGGREVSEPKLLEALWPEADGDAAAASFNMALKRLRELLTHPDAVLLSNRKLTLNPRLCWVDVWAFERGVSKQSTPLQLQRALALYRGPFLGTEETDWSLSARERLRVKFLGCVQLLGRHFEDRQQWGDAAELYQRGLHVDDLVEAFYQRLMVCQNQLGLRAEALTTYQRCKKTLAAHLGVEPSPATETLYRSLTA